MKKRNRRNSNYTTSENTIDSFENLEYFDIKKNTKEKFIFENVRTVIDDENYSSVNNNIVTAEIDKEWQKIEKKLKNDSIPKRYNRLNKRIIFFNILFLILAIISILSLLFMPFAKLDINYDNSNLANAIDNMDDNKLESVVGQYISKEDIKTLTKDISLQFGGLTFKSIDFLKFGLDKDLSKTKAVLKDYIQKNLTEPVNTIIEQASNSIMALSTKMAISLIVADIKVDDNDLQALAKDVQSALSILQESNGTNNNALADKATMAIINGTAYQNILEKNQIQLFPTGNIISNQINSVIKIIQKYATNDGQSQFSMNTVILNLDKVLTDIKNSQSTFFSSTRANDNTKINSNTIISNFIQNIGNTDTLVDNTINSLTQQQKLVLSYGIFTFGLLNSLSAAAWTWLAISIIIRFFFKRKAISLWSVIWLGGLQVIWMLPSVVVKLFNLTHIIQYVSYTWISFVASFAIMVLYFIFYRIPKISTKYMIKKSYI